MAFSSIPKVICRQIEKVVNISEVYACGLVGGKDLLGTFSIIMIGEKLKRKTEVEMLSKIFSGSLRRFKSQQALISSEKKYHQLVNTMNEGIMGRDNEGIIRFVNNSFCQITGYNEEELIGQPLEMFYSNESDKTWIRDRYKKQFSEKQSIFETQIKRKNGKHIWLEVSAAPWRNDSGELIGVYSVNTDITGRKQIEQKLQEAQKHLKQAAELAKVIPWKYDITNETISFNDTLLDTPFLKNNISLSMSKLIEDFVQPSDKSHISWIIDSCKKNINNPDFKIEFECHSKLPGGIDKVFYMKGNVTEDGLLSGMVQDVTDLVEAKEAAFYTEWKFKDLMHQSSDGIILMDKSGKVLEWNRQMERMTEKSAEEVTDTCIWEIKDLKNFDSIISEPFYQAVYESLVSTKDEIEYSFGEFEMLFPDMEKHTMAYSAFPVFSAKEALICVIIKDITKIKDQYELQKQLDVAHQTTEIRQQFLANMGHEMRTPLNGLIGMLEVLKTTRLTQTQIEFLDIASKSSDSLLYLINNILELSRMEIGVIKVTISIFPVNEMLQRMVQLFKPSAIEKNIKIEMLLNPANINYIESDEIKISQILSNLLSNAIKFTNEDGQVSINALLIEETKQKGRLIISVRDTGIGISEDQQHLLFKEFSQVDNTNTRKYDGAGLGLAIARQLTELLDGKIWVESKEGEGSNFSFEIPVGLIKEKSINPISPAFDIKLKALIVESRLLHQKLLGIMLQNRDIDVYIAGNAIQAIELFNDFTPNIVFIDSSLPDIEANDLIEKMKTAQKSNITDYILLASDFDQDADAKLFNSFNYYLQKPIKEQDLSSILKQIKTKYDIL
ncbi:MAG: PAS domain S-box protein [Bacteroidales bacterium]|nr:PAS domain S-box protein [Bacteroidales bacterium]